MFRLPRLLSRRIIFKKDAVNNCRSLYTVQSLGLDGYIATRQKTAEQFWNDGEKFRLKISEFLQDDKTMVFTEDLKNMVHLANSNDLELLEKMLLKFNKQNKEIRFGNFIFGPVVMRLFHHIKNSDFALKLFKDSNLDGFFDQLISYQILVDMLYEEGRYQDVIDVFSIIRSRQIQGGMHPKYVVVLVFAACYKENTPESFKYASELWSELNNRGHIPMRRAATFAAALALKQNAPHIAHEIIGSIRKQNYVTVRNIKVLALAELNRAEDALPILRSVLDVSNDPETKHTFTKDTISQLKESFNQSGNSELLQKFSKVEKALIENGHITDNTIHDLLITEISSIRNTSVGRNETVLAASYSKNRSVGYYNDRHQNYGNKMTNQRRRPGLCDME